MVIVHAVGPGAAAYYFEGKDPGHWFVGSEELLGLRGAVTQADLEAVLRGCDPADGRYLPDVRPARRRGGWDLIFAAPKSLSLLVGTGRCVPGDIVVQAQSRAVEKVLAHLERGLEVSDRRAAAGVGPGGGLIAACFGHRTNAAGEPHLHTHALIANLTRRGTGWCAVRDRPWSIDRRAVSSLYLLALRREVARVAPAVEWRLRPDGLMDAVGVPRSAIRAASTQSTAADRFAVRRPAGRRMAPASTARAVSGTVPRWAPPRATGGTVPGLSGGGTELAEAGLDDPLLSATVRTRLAGTGSRFRQADVISALASCHPGGADPDIVEGWVRNFCAGSIEVPSPTRSARWTTLEARRVDDRLLSVLQEAGPAQIGAGRGGVIVATAPPGGTSLLAVAETMEGWAEAAGERTIMEVAAPSPAAAARWDVLAGLGPHRAGSPCDVLVVNRADRRSSADLLSIVAGPLRRGATVVLVEGGTLPRRTEPLSLALVEFADAAGRFVPPPPSPWGPVPQAPGQARNARVAAAGLLSGWDQARRAGSNAVMVGLGLEEVVALNRGAAALLGGPGRAGDGSEQLACSPSSGDRVVVLRAGGGRPPIGSLGTVLSRGEERGSRTGSLRVQWDGDRRPATIPDCGRRPVIGLGYALTPAIAVRAGVDVHLFGPPHAVPALARRLAASIDRHSGMSLDRSIGL